MITPNTGLSLQKRAVQAFRERYENDPTAIVRAPGRVNLIGEHTDYNEGYVLPMAIDRAVWIALQPRTGDNVQVYSLDFDEAVTFSLDAVRHLGANSGEHWGEYLKGTAWAMQERGYTLRGWEGVMAGDIPMGAGLSSSAALEVATARALAHVAGIPSDPATMALIAQRAENRWVGIQCGVMDQMISAAGEADHALLIDCRSLQTEPVPLPPGTVCVIMDTSTRRGLVDSAYNERRRQCEAAAAHFSVSFLRDVTLDAFIEQADMLDAVTRRRARHVITENARTLQAAKVMRMGDAESLGRLMNASHASLRDDFQVSSRELDAMVSLAQQHAACYGARMTGAGFGGCAVALVDAARCTAFAEEVGQAYEAETRLMPAVYISTAAAGASVYVPDESGR